MLERIPTKMPQETPSSTSGEIVDAILVKEESDDADILNLFKEYSEMTNIINTFPWISDFKKACQSEFSSLNMKRLLKLMTIYFEKVSPSVTECLTRPNRARKLKKNMSDTLMFFHMTHSGFRISSPNDLSTYLHKMSDLMAMYLDMEIKASRTGAECLPKIASKICSSLIIFFGKSYEYIFDTILKSKLITDNARVLCDLIFRRVLRDFPGPCIDVISYLRCLFVFKIWKAISKESEEKVKIIKLACMKLRPPPGLASRLSGSKALRDFLPRIPKNCPDITDFLMRAKFCSRNQIQLFLKAAENPTVFFEFQHAVKNDLSDERSGFVGLMDDIWSDFNLKCKGSSDRSGSAENKKIIRPEQNSAKNESKKINRTKDIAEVECNATTKANVKSHISSVQNDPGDIIVTSSLMHGPKSSSDDIYIDAIDSCVKSEEDPDPSMCCMKELLDDNTVLSNTNIFSDVYDIQVAARNCLEEELHAAFIEDSFNVNLDDTAISIEKLTDVNVETREDFILRDYDLPPLVTSHLFQSKTQKISSGDQNCEKNGKYNYNTLHFNSSSLLLIQDDEISESDLNSFGNSEGERQLVNEDNIVPKPNSAVINHEGTIKFKTPAELKLPPKYFYEKDIIKLALSAKGERQFQSEDSITPKPKSAARNQERKNKFKTPAERKLASHPKYFYEQDIIKLALSARSTKRKSSEPDPPSMVLRKSTRRKSQRIRAESLAKSMSSALDDIETDNWIESSTNKR